jgi:hypothetical protein
MLGPLIDAPKKRMIAFAAVGGLLLLAVLLVPLKQVTMKMLPFDNKSELQVIIDMPEGRTLEDTAAVTRALSEYLKTVPEVTDYQAYVGTAAPYNFNGLVRHYFLREGSNVADIQVNFVGKSDRRAQSHDIAKRLRPELKRIADRHDARIKIAELPPGPPVLSTLVAEIYGPETSRRIEIARQVRDIFEKTRAWWMWTGLWKTTSANCRLSSTAPGRRKAASRRTPSPKASDSAGRQRGRRGPPGSGERTGGDLSADAFCRAGRPPAAANADDSISHRPSRIAWRTGRRAGRNRGENHLP